MSESDRPREKYPWEEFEESGDEQPDEDPIETLKRERPDGNIADLMADLDRGEKERGAGEEWKNAEDDDDASSS